MFGSHVAILTLGYRLDNPHCEPSELAQAKIHWSSVCKLAVTFEAMRL